jgi:NAD(P)-dependent dehydrogenase (short-subunit alcohol dehydrogenase family)
MGRLEHKTAIITGAGSGFGRAMALRFSAEGARVLAADMTGNEAKVAAEAKGEVLPYRCDVTNADQVAAMVATCEARFGRVDVLCNNAGIGGSAGKRIHEVSYEDWDRVMAVNLRGAFSVLKHALPLMIKSGGGAVVNTASIGGFLATPTSSAYIASKGGVVMLTRVAALEYVKDNIRVNAVCPGVCQTGIIEGMSPDMYGMLAAQIPQGRLGTADEVASLALFLASDEAAHITGACYIIDGGRSAG